MQPQPTTCAESEPFALQVIDDSMEPEFKQGCIIIIDPSGQPEDGAFVFAEQEDGYIFRRLALRDGGVFLEPLNEAYPSTELQGGLAAVKGVIVQRAGTRRSYHKRYG